VTGIPTTTPWVRSRRDQLALGTAATGGLLAALGSTMTWYTIAVGGIAGPGGSATGLEGRDGRTVLAAAVVALGAAALVAVGRRRTVAKVALLAAGAVTSIVAVAGIVDAISKDEEVESEFGIPADRVVAEVGAGLWLVAAGGVGLLAAGAAAEPEP
jgi:hypothetical protein